MCSLEIANVFRAAAVLQAIRYDSAFGATRPLKDKKPTISANLHGPHETMAPIVSVRAFRCSKVLAMKWLRASTAVRASKTAVSREPRALAASSLRVRARRPEGRARPSRSRSSRATSSRSRKTIWTPMSRRFARTAEAGRHVVRFDVALPNARWPSLGLNRLCTRNCLW